MRYLRSQQPPFITSIIINHSRWLAIPLKNTMDNREYKYLVGQDSSRPLSYFGSAALLIEGARFNDEVNRLLPGGTTHVPQGLYFFKTHEEANQFDLEWLAKKMAKIPDQENEVEGEKMPSCHS